MAVAGAQYGWRLDLSEIAAIWRAGCIIRARMLDRIMDAYERDPSLQSLLLAEHFRDAVASAEGAWRKAVSLAVAAGVPTPAFSSTLAYYDGLRRARGPDKPDSGPARLFRRAYLPQARQARRVPHPLGARRRRGTDRLRAGALQGR